MSQKSSFLQAAKSVSQALMGNTLRDGETTPDMAYNTAQVGGYAESNGGDQDAIDLKETILWLQKENVRVAATS